MEDDKFGARYFRDNLGENSTIKPTLKQFIFEHMNPPKNSSVLDVGSGRAYIEKMLSDPLRNVEVVSCDVTEESRKYVDGRFEVCSMTDLPFKDASFDRVFCIDVLSHFKDGERGVQEAYRVLKDGGKLMISTPNKYFYHYTSIAQRIRKKTFSFKYDKTAEWLYSRRSLEKILSSRPWASLEFIYFDAAPRLFNREWMRQTLIAIATKGGQGLWPTLNQYLFGLRESSLSVSKF